MSETRLIIISGKGGVGKTTVAAATAAAGARRGNRTLVVSLDRAHNLGDVFQCSLGAIPAPIPGIDCLYAIEIDPQAELGDNQPILKTYLSRLFAYLGMDNVKAQEMAVFPGLEELLVLSRLAQLASDNTYDLIVADMAPTASSLRYLSFPDMMEGVLGKLVTWDQRFSAVLRPLQGRYLKMPVPENEVYESLRYLAKGLDDLRRLLANPAHTAVRLVMTPEHIVLEETRRALTYLSLFGLTVDSVVVNRLLPKDATEVYLQAWGRIQDRVVALAEESFVGLPIRHLYFQPTEVIGIPQLLKTAVELYGDSDPLLVQKTALPLAYAQKGENTVFSIHLPNATGRGLDLKRIKNELILTVDSWRRRILLPDFLINRPVVKAKFSNGYLHVSFGPKTND